MTEFTDNLFEVGAAEDVPIPALRTAMEKHTFACIRGIVPEDEVRHALDVINERFDYRLDHPAAGQPASAVRTNFQKLNMGGESSTANHDDARFFRAFYNPLWEPDVYSMRHAFAQLIRVRNRIADLPLDFATDKIEPNGLWTAARFHQYPAGGGFFRRHTDYVVKDIADENSTRFYQVVLTMTQKGEHYEQGGAFVDVEGERLFLDDSSRPGDIVIYDGRTVHGVEDIDPHKLLDLTTINGRLAGFVTLFKKM
jgi:hypothetical protein